MGSMYVLSTGCQWRAIPKDLPPRSTVFAYLDLWSYDGTLERIHHELYVKCREQADAVSEPHSRHHRQSKREERRKRGHSIDPNGYDAGKKIKGKKRHILVEHAWSSAAGASFIAADIQDRDGGILLLSTLFGLFPFLKKLFADGGYQGPQFQEALANALPELNVEIVKRSDQATGFRSSPQTLDRREDLRLAQPMPQTRQGF